MRLLTTLLLCSSILKATANPESIQLTDENPRLWTSTPDGSANAQGVSQYRIPHMFVKPNGDILACCVGRLSKANDHGISASFFALSKDNGKTWDKFNASYTDWKENKPPKGALPLSHMTNEVNAVWNEKEQSYTCIYMHQHRVYMAKSKDLLIWSEPKLLDIARNEDGGHLKVWQCPTSMLIDQSTGEVGFAVCGINNKRWVVRLIWTTDFEIFEESANLPKGSCNETNFVHLEGSKYFVTSRGNNKHINWVYDRKENTWTQSAPMAIPHRGSCQGDIVKDTKGDLFISLPSDPTSRLSGGIYQSKDSGSSWKQIRTLNDTYFGYSSLVFLKDGSLAILSERERAKGRTRGTSLQFHNLGHIK